MSRVKDPGEKKALEYTKDHRYGGEYPHAFRRNFPRKRARANRAYRHRVRQFVEHANVDLTERTDPPVRRTYVRKWGASPLGVWIAYRQSVRALRTVGKILRSLYTAANRERFVAF